jgi:hypothetical protein
VNTYDEYLTLLAAVQADQERQGRNVLRVKMAVGEMRRRLNKRRLPNTPDNRAAICGLAVNERNP